MIKLRRLEIVAVFFMIWACAIGLNVISAALLGYSTWVQSDHLLSKFVFALGITWQVIFQGPSPAEILQRLSKRLGPEQCTLDRVYMAFRTDRTVRLICALILFGIVASELNLVGASQMWPGIGGFAIVTTFSVLSLIILRIRVSASQFGTTQYEAKQLVRFLQQIESESQDQSVPPRPLRALFEVPERATAPGNAEVAN